MIKMDTPFSKLINSFLQHLKNIESQNNKSNNLMMKMVINFPDLLFSLSMWRFIAADVQNSYSTLKFNDRCHLTGITRSPLQ